MLFALNGCLIITPVNVEPKVSLGARRAKRKAVSGIIGFMRFPFVDGRFMRTF